MADPSSPTSMLTHSGIYFDPCHPDPADVRLEDVAVALARFPRWSGSYCKMVEWSGAQHSLLACDLASPDLKLCTLLHDATEAYLGGDLPTPVKRALPEYRALEDRVWRLAVAPAFGLPAVIPAEVHEADRRALVTEARDLFEPRGIDKRELGWSWLPEGVEVASVRSLEGRMFRGHNRVDRAWQAFMEAFAQLRWSR